MAKFKRGKQLRNWKSNSPDAKPGKLRIVGGKFRGRQINYLGEARTRPMKDNIREALFNLVGGWIPGKAVIDLFAGTGAVGLEGISRGASQAILIERHFPTAKVIRENVDLLGGDLPVQVESSDTFFWTRQFFKPEFDRPSEPWVVFCCAPYQLYLDETEKMLEMLAAFQEAAPANSLIVVESDSRFQTSLLPQADLWKVRQYSPAMIAVCKLGFDDDSPSQVSHG
jgi:16S rRNA (guanine966-N2)-methyltransferase